MGIPGSANLLLAAAEAESYQIEQSLRFDGNAYLQYQPSAAGNEEAYTISLWVKGMDIATTNRVVCAYISGSNYEELIHVESGQLNSFRWTGSYSYRYISNARYRDLTGWYHIVLAVDHNNATSSLRRRYFINGQEITSWSTETDPAQSLQGVWNSTGTHALGSLGDSGVGYSTALKGYLAEVHHVDGQTLGPTDFGEYDESGVWRPIEYSGTYGNNGWYLTFDPTAANGIGHDHSGNGNNWTPYGFTTSGGFTDVMNDTPTKNWCTANPLAETGSNIDIEDGNLVVKATSSGDGAVDATIAVPTSGKFYVEATLIQVASGINQFRMGLQPTNDVAYARPGDNTDSYGFRWSDSAGTYVAYDEGTQTSYGTAAAAHGDVVGITIDRDNGEIKAHINNTYFNSGNAVVTGIPTTSNYLFRISVDGGSKRVGGTLNFGQREFAYPPGTSSATAYFNTVTYTGAVTDTSTQAVTGVGFQPDFVWIKRRNGTNAHQLVNVVSGAGKWLESDNGSGENTTNTNGVLTSFDSDGFTLTGGSTNANLCCESGNTYVAWCWKAGGTASSNTDGSQTASVSASDTAGFSVMKWDYSGSSSYTVGHGLSTAPKVLFLKKTDGSTNWFVRHGAVHTGNGALFLNETTTGDSGSTAFSGTAPTDSVITVNGALTDLRGEHVCYAFAEKAGVSSFGSYTGNGSEDGPQIYTGFKPALVIFKRTDSSGNWFIFDTARGDDVELFPDSSSGEGTFDTILLTNTGFKLRSSTSDRNANGGTYAYMAFAENFSADTDFKALNTENLPAPDIKDGSVYFNTVTYTGDGQSSQAVTGVGFQPNLSWVKNRSRGNNHVLQDSVRGITASNGNQLVPNSGTITENSNSNGHVGSYDSDGFTVEDGTSGSFPRQGVNYNNDSYVAWLWKAGTASGSSNTAGTITSTVSANPSAGFSIATYTGNGTDSATVGHGLGVEPTFYIIFNRGVSTYPAVWHSALTDAQVLRLSETTFAQVPGTAYFQPENNSSTVISLGTNNETNANGDNYVAYIFAEVEGYCKISSYTGNGDNDGPCVYTGFRPALVLTKQTSNTSNWIILDSTRDVDNPAENWLRPNSSGEEENTSPDLDIDFLANGFKIRNNGTDGNINGNTYAYVAFAENPFGGNGVSPAPAR